MSFLFAASRASAETLHDDTKSLASILNLKATSLMGQKSSIESITARTSKALKQVCVSVDQGLDAFLDLKSPYPQDPIRTKNSRDDVRAVVGIHFLF